jgi:hypothetical protein
VRSPTSSSAPPRLRAHSDSSDSHRHKRNTKNPRFSPPPRYSVSQGPSPHRPCLVQGTPGIVPTHGIGVVPHHLR